jgi:hypothetical protein
MTTVHNTLTDSRVPMIAALHDRGAALLDELDTLITELAAIVAEQGAARAVLADTESELAVIEASLSLSIEGRNEQERKARLVLALHEDAGFQELTRIVREARASIHQTEGRMLVTKERCRLVRAALELVGAHR